MIEAYLECDSNGKVLMKQLMAYEAGERLKPPLITVRDNRLTAKSVTDSMSIYMALRDRYTEKNSGEIREVVREVKVNVLTGWQRLRIGIGSLMLLLLPLALYLKIKGKL